MPHWVDVDGADVGGGGPPYDAVDSVTGFALTLRAAGVAASPERVQAAVQAMAALDPSRVVDVYWAGRLTLCGTPDDLARYDAAFRAYFGDRPGTIVRRQWLSKPALRVVSDGGADAEDEEGDGEQLSGAATASSVEQLRHRDVSRLTPQERAELHRLLALLRLPGELRPTRRRRPSPRGPVDPERTLRAWLRAGGEQLTGAATASSVEQLRHRDVSRLTPQERAELNRLLALLRLPGEARPTRRRRPSPRGPVDPERTLRAWLRAGGEPAQLRRHRATSRPRRVVLLVDVSGSMDAYADALLRFAHAAARRTRVQTEVFVLGTRLSRVTREMAHRDPDVALGLVNEVSPDAGGGTRLGVLLKEFLDRWGQRGTARGAIVVVLSDGWERDDPRLLGEQVQRLSRLAHRVVWANPRKAAPGFTPVAGGMAAALPHVDDFVEGHSLAAYEHLAAVVLGRQRAGAPRA